MKSYVVLTMLLTAIFHQNFTVQKYPRTMSAPIRLRQANQKFRLHQTVHNHDCYDFKRLLEKHYDPNKQTPDGMTALHLAAERNYTGMITLLLRHNANPNITNSPLLRQCTPLHLAVLNFHTPTVFILAQHPATDLTIKDITGQTALQLAIKYDYKEAIEALTPNN